MTFDPDVELVGRLEAVPTILIEMAAELLARKVPGEQPIVGRIQSSTRRMGRLLTDLTDFTRGRLGDGIPVDARHLDDVGRLFASVVDELRTASPGRPKLFEPFVRQPTDRPGLGLGLFIVGQIARSHGGTVAVESGPPATTTFICTLPRSASAAVA